MSSEKLLELCQWVALTERKAADLKEKAQRDTDVWFREGERAAYADMRSRMISMGLAVPEHFVPADVGGYSVVPSLGDRRRAERDADAPTGYCGDHGEYDPGYPCPGCVEEKKEESKNWFINHYECPYDGTVWDDEWDCMCNDRCPKCNKEIEPYDSEQVRGD